MGDEAEPDRLAGRTILRTAMAILAVLAVVLVLLAWLSRHYRAGQPAPGARYPVPSPPRIDPAPRAELEHYLVRQNAHLQSYGWVDEEQGWAHIPIERAMELYVRQAKEGEQQ